MTFIKRLRDGVRSGDITCSVRIWMRPRVHVGALYRMEEGEIEIDSIVPQTAPSSGALHSYLSATMGSTRIARREGW